MPQRKRLAAAPDTRFILTVDDALLAHGRVTSLFLVRCLGASARLPALKVAGRVVL